jgi:hypothetical protein
MMFVVIMDILKYCMGIDPVAEDREHIQNKKHEKRCQLLAVRFIYVPAPGGSPWPKAAARMGTETVI